jgi:2,5-diketo-D-gluconate reductase A
MWSGQPVAVLNNGVEIPQLGVGVLQIPLEQTPGVVERALQIGYRHIDTAARYGNEAGVGEGIRRSGLTRDDLFVTTKLPNDRHGRRLVRGALEESLSRLRLDHVDLFLIHWPLPLQDLYAETWQGMEDTLVQGKARAIGVSNFLIPHLERLRRHSRVTPAVNQIELHPVFQQRELARHNTTHGIRTQAWGPLGRGQYPLLQDTGIRAIAQDHGKTPAQVVIRWHLQNGNIVFPKSRRETRLRENFAVFDFSLSPGQMAAIDQLDAGQRIGPDPAEFTG